MAPGCESEPSKGGGGEGGEGEWTGSGGCWRRIDKWWQHERFDERQYGWFDKWWNGKFDEQRNDWVDEQRFHG